MTDVLERLKKIKTEAESRQREHDRLQGQRDQLRKRLKDEFGLDSLKDANAEADRLVDEVDRLEKELEKAITALESELENAIA